MNNRMEKNMNIRREVVKDSLINTKNKLNELARKVILTLK